LVLPALGGLFILVVIFYSVKDASGLSPAFVAIAWVVLGLLVAVFAGGLAQRIGASLTQELDEVDKDHTFVDTEAR
jgi:hypothetical protein